MLIYMYVLAQAVALLLLLLLVQLLIPLVNRQDSNHQYSKYNTSPDTRLSTVFT